MDWQTVLSALLVAGCSAFAAWRVVPAALQRRLAAWVGQPLPAANGGCGGGCDGCAATPSVAPAPGLSPGESVIRIVRQPPR
jgi:hypothetical protein